MLRAFGRCALFFVVGCSLTTNLDGFAGGGRAAGSDAGLDAQPDAPSEGGSIAESGCHGEAGTMCGAIAPSCDALHKADPTAASGVFTLNPPDPSGAGSATEPFAAYCEMTQGGGGFTLVLKVDGTKSTFAYDAALWTSQDSYQPDRTALDTNEAKLPSFSRNSLTALLIAMIDSDRVTRWLTASFTAPSLYALISGKSYRPFKANPGKDAWEGLMQSGSLQPNCDREGFNVGIKGKSYVRLGIMNNNENDCNSPDSAIGVGMAPAVCANAPDISAGNVACVDADRGDRDTPVFAYVFVR